MTLPAIDHAAAELHAAALAADTHAAGDPFNPWTALAAQLRLVAAGLDPAPSGRAPRRDLVADHLTAALDELDALDTATGFADLAFWRHHVAHLRAEASRLETLAGQPQGHQ